MNCGTKVPVIPKKDKLKKKKIRSKAKIVIPVVTILILSVLTFLVYGGDLVPEKIRNLKGYSYLTGMAKDKLPDQIRLPFELTGEFPFDFSFELPFELPDPRSLLAGIMKPDEKEGPEDSEDVEGSENSRDSKGDNGKAGEEEATDRQIVEAMEAGVDDSIIIRDKSLYADIASDWKRIRVEVLEHNTDAGAGVDTVVVYLELENSYVNMAGTREIQYRYNEQTGTWDAEPVSKIVCLSMEPVQSALL